jgi:hypothetical protein
MFKYLLTMLLTLVFGTSTVALSQDYYCYRESGSTVELMVQDSIISVKMDESRSSWASLFQQVPGLNPAVAPEPISAGFSLLRLRPGYDIGWGTQRITTAQ